MPKDSSPRKIVVDRKRKTWGTVSTKRPREISPWIKTTPHKTPLYSGYRAAMGSMFVGKIRIL